MSKCLPWAGLGPARLRLSEEWASPSPTVSPALPCVSLGTRGAGECFGEDSSSKITEFLFVVNLVFAIDTLKAYILKGKKSADSAFRSKKI